MNNSSSTPNFPLHISKNRSIFIPGDRCQIPDGRVDGLLSRIVGFRAFALADAQEASGRRSRDGEVIQRLDFPQAGLVDHTMGDQELCAEFLDLEGGEARLFHQAGEGGGDFFFLSLWLSRGAGGVGDGRFILLAGPISQPRDPLGDLGAHVVDRIALGFLLAHHEARPVVAPVEEFLARGLVG